MRARAVVGLLLAVFVTVSQRPRRPNRGIGHVGPALERNARAVATMPRTASCPPDERGFSDEEAHGDQRRIATGPGVGKEDA
jgi:hypothetical protein